MLSYTICYLLYTIKSKQVILQQVWRRSINNYNYKRVITDLKYLFQKIIAAVSFFGTILIVTDVFTSDELHGQYILGVIACCLAVGFFASPLVSSQVTRESLYPGFWPCSLFQASLLHVVRTRSTEVLPFGMIVANFIAGALWGLYGLIIQDNFLKITNFLGVCLSTFLLLLYVHFPARPPIPRSSSSTEPLINRKDSTFLDMWHPVMMRRCGKYKS